MNNVEIKNFQEELIASGTMNDGFDVGGGPSFSKTKSKPTFYPTDMQMGMKVSSPGLDKKKGGAGFDILGG